MYVVFLAGGIASGKSSVARRMADLGAWRVDLDAISREVLEPGTETLAMVAEEFGEDLIDPETGELDRALLARRAFASREDAARLEAIELPAIAERLAHALTDEPCGGTQPVACVVEVPLLDRMTDMLDLADEVVVVTCPLGVRRDRAILRGMTGADFDARVENQPSDEWLAAHADVVFDNRADVSDLLAQVDRWWGAHAAAGWSREGRA